MTKLFLISAFCITHSILAMQNPDTPFSEEGLVEQDHPDQYAIMWKGYDDYLLKSKILLQVLEKIIAEQQSMIIKRKFGADFLEYFNKHIKTGYPFCMAPIIRYSHAVCWRFLGDKMIGKPKTNDDLEQAERQIPLDVAEFRFIILGEDNHFTKASCNLINDFKNKSHAEQRKHLNEFLNNMKERTLSEH